MNVFDDLAAGELTTIPHLSASGRYLNDRIYADYEFTDETSMYDSQGSWCGGSDSYWRKFQCRVPRKMLERFNASGKDAEITDWIDRNSEKPIWL